MSIAMTAQQRADLRDPDIPKQVVWALLLQPDGGDIAINSSNVELTYDSVTYAPGMDKFYLDGQLSTGAALVPESLAIRFDANDQYITGKPLYTLLQDDWHLRSMKLSCLFFNANTGSFIISPRSFFGTMERLSVQESPTGQAIALLECETGTFRALDSNRVTCSDRDQRLRSSTDSFFQNIAVTGTRQIPFGISTQNVPGFGSSTGVGGGGGGEVDHPMYRR